MVIYILAIDKNNLIGKTDSKMGLPWYYPEDLEFFKENTLNKICVMGRNTYQAMGQALKDRTNIILTRNKDFSSDDALVFHTPEEILQKYSNEDIYILGGPQTFNSFEKHVDKIILTRINNEYSGDIFYNNIDSLLDSFSLEDSYTGVDTDLTFQTWIKKNI